MIIPLILIFVTQSENMKIDVAQAQSYRALSSIVSSAEEVYFQGTPSQKTIKISLPKGITSIVVNDSYIEFNINTGKRNYIVYKDTVANLTGTIRPFAGEHVLTFKSQGAMVLIEDN